MSANKYFRVVAKKGDKAVSIVADTLIDAQCQARELCDGNKPFVFHEEFLPVEFSNAHFERLNETMSAMFCR